MLQQAVTRGGLVGWGGVSSHAWKHRQGACCPKKKIKKHALEIRTTTFWTQRDFDPNLFWGYTWLKKKKIKKNKIKQLDHMQVGAKTDRFYLMEPTTSHFEPNQSSLDQHWLQTCQQHVAPQRRWVHLSLGRTEQREQSRLEGGAFGGGGWEGEGVWAKKKKKWGTLYYITQQAPGGGGVEKCHGNAMRENCHGNTIATVASFARWWCDTAQTCYSGMVVRYTLQSHQH